MTLAATLPPPRSAKIPRAEGTLRLSSKSSPRGPTLDDLYQKGALKAVFPRSDHLTGVIVNTSGGVTGGDNFDVSATAGPGSHLTLTTQAAERAYRALPGSVGRIRTRLAVETGATLFWLPQETIVFDHANISRHLRCDMSQNSEVLLVEPMIFGRAAMGEHDITARIRDRIELWQDGQPRHIDAWTLDGDLSQSLARPAVADGATAMSSLIYAGPRAEAHLNRIRPLLPDTAGASLKAPDLLILRLLAKNGYELRKSILPILDNLTDHSLPICWRL